MYDVTKFLEDHPGGDEVLLAVTGKTVFATLVSLWFLQLLLNASPYNIAGIDATDDFESVGHSDDARELVQKYYIGEVDSSTIPAKRKYNPPPQVLQKSGVDSEYTIKILQFLVPLLILGVAFALRFFAKKED